MVRSDIKDFLNTIPSNVTVVAATKYVQSEDMKVLLDAGITNFGENRVDAFLTKYDELKNFDITWHFIGHLQRNKAKQVINKIEYLHSLDSLELAKLINEHRNTPLKCFVEVSINLEETKNGVPFYDAKDFISKLNEFKNIELVGLMMMAIKNDTEENVQEQFHKLNLLKEEIEKDLNITIPYLSMGMSDDYKEAIKEGATHIRLGRILFK